MTHQGVTVVTMHYKDKFGRPKQFVFTARLKDTDQGQSHDVEVKQYLKKLGVRSARVQYDDFCYRVHRPHQFSGHYSAPHRLVPKRRRRAVCLKA